MNGKTKFVIPVFMAVFALMFAIHNRCEIPVFNFDTNYGADVADEDAELDAQSTTGINLQIMGCKGPR